VTAITRPVALLVLAAIGVLTMVACRTPTPPAAQPPKQGLGYLHTDGARLLSADGAEQRIRAVSWFGMETETCAPHGLDEVSLDAVLSSIASMGFNTVRLPFSSACLTAATSTGVDPSLNPELAGAAPLQVMDLVVQRAADHHLSVLLDRHRISSHQQSDLWYDASHSESDWIDDWTALARRYADDATVIGADLHNEPHGAACWGCGDPARDWAAAATRAGNAVLTVNPNWLVVVEGVEHQTVGESTWWGGGLADARHTPITLQQPHRVVYSPHAYPPSIFNQPQFTEAGFPDNLPAYWDRTWGYLQTENIAPVLLGEFGSKLATARDRAWMATMVDYLNDTRMSFGYWSYNPDSVDTGGLVQKNWVTQERAKLTALAPLFLELPAAPETAPPTASAPASTPAPSPPAATTAAPSVSPSASVSAEPGPSSPSTGPGTLTARWQTQSSWGDGYAVNLVLTATGAPTSAWQVSWPDADATSIQNSWGAECTVDQGQVVCQGKDWGAWIPAGASVTVGVQVLSTGGSPTTPTLSATRVR
jgi:endoglucanase